LVPLPVTLPVREGENNFHLVNVAGTGTGMSDTGTGPYNFKFLSCSTGTGTVAFPVLVLVSVKLPIEPWKWRHHVTDAHENKKIMWEKSFFQRFIKTLSWSTTAPVLHSFIGISWN
jgi:hypothetical protein